VVPYRMIGRFPLGLQEYKVRVRHVEPAPRMLGRRGALSNDRAIPLGATNKKLL